jgi:hypothetical protein
MALVITKKVRTILLIVLTVLVVGGGGFLIWRVTQEESVAPEDSEAACTDPCIYIEGDGKDWYCINGEMTQSFPAGCYESYQITVDGTQRNCWKDCTVTPPGGGDTCEDSRISSDSGKPVGERCSNSSYPYECGIYCYTAAKGPECCGKEGPPAYCVPEYPDYNSLPYTTTAASQKSELIIYYNTISPYTSLAQFIIEDPDGQNHTINVGSASDKINTGIILEAGEKAVIRTVKDSPSGNLSIGWQSLNADNTCGSGAMGPIQNNDCERYKKKSVSTYIKPNPNGDEKLISRQCWADSKEWEGDYDFNDYFVQLYYLPITVEAAVPACGTLEGNYSSDTTDWPEGTFCSVGVADPTSPTFPSQGGETTWTCNIDGNTVSCLATRDIAIVETNPDWTIVKDVAGEYIVVNEENFARADYTVTVTNIGDGEGSIDKIVDELDDKALEDYIQEISNNGTYASSSITWDLVGEDEIFSPQESLQLTYSLQIPESAYGTYRNLVTAYPREGDNFSDDATITFEADEEEVIVEEIPQTGIFDSVLGRVSVGVSFIFLGGLVSQYGKINYLLNSISEKQEFRSEIRKQRKAKRRRERLEDRFKND